MIERIKNVVCIRWGDPSFYSSKHVNNLCRSVLRNISGRVNFYCFTDNPDGLDDNIIAKALPILRNVEKVGCAIYKKEAGLCDDGLGELNGQRVLYFDLDTTIVDNIDPFFEIPEGDGFYIIKDWNHGENTKVGQASCYSWRVGTLGHVKSYFEENYEEIYKKFGSASQEYLSSKVFEKFGEINFWPDTWCRSFKRHCLPNPIIPFLRKFRMASIPAGAKIICFHGRPKAEDAVQGLWPGQAWYKRLFYKHLKPVTWLEDYLDIPR
ncbi:MAG: hypothetical protein LBI29_04295 [Rickettsiales bacterium]|jgi:hypothetical protein|nr:hypothetical protein [Rickettsiales bacterium]